VTSAPPASSFSFEPVFAVAVIGAAWLYIRAGRREHVSVWRATLFVLGLLCIVAPLNSPLETIAANYLLLGHLIQNAIITDWAPPLLILGLTPRMREGIAQWGGDTLERFSRPGLTLCIWLGAWYGTHAVALYDFALTHPWALNVEHAILIAAGLLFWWPVLRGAPRGLSPGICLLYLATAFAAASFLGLAFTFVQHPFYPFYRDAPRLWGLSAGEDQNIGGVVMNAEQSIVFVAAIAYVFFRLLEEDEQEDESVPDAVHNAR
jgi:putative membrane protein